MRRSIRPPSPAGELPPGWQSWLDAMPARPGGVHGAPAPEIVSLLAAREPAPSPPGEVLENRWQVFTVLWRQHWEPAPDDERGLRRLSSTVSGVLHLVWLFLLAWLMVVPPWAGPTQVGEDSAIEVTWIGEGTPRDEGAGPPAAAEAVIEAPETRQAPSPPPPSPAPQPEPVPANVADAATQPPRPQPEPAPVAAEQPLVVTETATPDTTFVVPPPPEVPVLQPRLRERTVELREREIAMQEPVEPARLELPALRPVEAAPTEQPVVELAEREIAAPVWRPDAPRIAVPSVQAPVVESDAPAARVREIALRETSQGQGASADVEAAATASAAQAASARSGATASTDAGTRPDAVAAGAGPSTSAAPGAIPSPRAGDDWDTAAQERPGGQAGTAGLFNRDGRPQLPPGAGGRVGGGLPPGTVTEDYEKIDRMGTWLRRPPSDFEATSLDRFWVPHENLLEEWVRRSVRTVLIPIPGTSKSIRCDVALLAFGGGCGITDPNLQDVEAGARPPPDIPYKPELQENDDAW